VTIVATYHAEILNIENNLAARCDSIEAAIDTKVDASEVETLRQQCDEQEQKISELSFQFKAYFENVKREQLSRDAYSKRFNFLIHGLEETSNNDWETRKQTDVIFRKFLSERLKIDNPKDFPKDFPLHRLPQHPIKSKQGTKINRPIIFKVGNNYDKQYIMKRLKYLKTYNVDRKRKSMNKVL